jgi:hypothetical protein
MSERELSDLPGLSSELLAVFELGDAAARTIAAVISATSAGVEAGWTQCDAQARNARDPAYGLGYWATYPPAKDGGSDVTPWEDAWFEWGVFPATDGSPWESWALVAGLTVGDSGGPLGRASTESWRAARRAEEFVETSVDSFDRMFRFRGLDALLVADTVAAQADVASSWILDVFSCLNAVPPPL